MAPTMFFTSVLTLVLALKTAASTDFDDHRAGFDFIYHEIHNLLLTVQDQTCHFTFVADSFVGYLTSEDNRRLIEGEIAKLIVIGDQNKISASSLADMREKFDDLLANFHCTGKSVYTLLLDLQEILPTTTMQTTPATTPSTSVPTTTTATTTTTTVTTTTVPSTTGRPESAWLQKACNHDGECPAHNSMCFDGTCLCNPGYFFSQNSDACIETCSITDVTSYFVKYAGRYIEAHDITVLHSVDLAQCFSACIKEYNCRSVDRIGQNCHLQYVTPGDVAAFYWLQATGFHAAYYQRTCV